MLEKRVLEIAASGQHSTIFIGVQKEELDLLINEFYTNLYSYIPNNNFFINSCRACPCGNLGGTPNSCHCTLMEVKKYYSFLYNLGVDLLFQSGYPYNDNDVQNEPFDVVYSRIKNVWNIQKERFGVDNKYNSQMSVDDVKQYCVMDKECQLLVNRIKNRFFNDNEYYTTLKIARTLADMDGEDLIKSYHFSEALGYRTGFRAFCENV